MVFLPESPLHNPVLSISSESKKALVESIVKPFKLSKQDCIEIKEIFLQQMIQGLSSNPDERKASCLLMENTFMTNLPTGKETGDFLSLDLGSTNFRVILSRLKGGKEDDDFVVKYYDVPAELRVGESALLFNFLAECIQSFMREQKQKSTDLDHNKIPLAFSFSYPMVQQSVDTGYLVAWTKSYDLPDAIGKDAAQLLRDAIKAQEDLEVDVVAILNDSTGTLLKGAYLSQDCVIGMIFGSGFNACYVEQVDQISKLTDQNREKLQGSSQVAVDIECGAFGDNGCIDKFKSDVDRELDQDSLFTNSFSFEKMFAGNFLGDVARRLLLKLAEKNALFDGIISDALRTKDSLMASDLVDIERNGAEKVRELGSRMGYENLSEDDIRIFHYVGKIVAIRAAVLTSTLLSALIDRIARERNVVAIDGSLYSHHPSIHKLMMDVISELSPGKVFDIISAKDGSGKGAGLAAAVLSTGN